MCLGAADVDEEALQEADYDQLMRERAKRKFEDMANGADKPKKCVGAYVMWHVVGRRDDVGRGPGSAGRR
jgi:hypothetical protein